MHALDQRPSSESPRIISSGQERRSTSAGTHDPGENPARILWNHVPLEPPVALVAVEILNVPLLGLPFASSLPLPPCIAAGAGKKCTDSAGFGGEPNRKASCACETAGEGKCIGGGEAVTDRRSSNEMGERRWWG